MTDSSLPPLLLLPLPVGDVLITLKEGLASMHNRDRLMHVAFNGIGGFPMAKVNKARQEATVQVWMSARSKRQAGADRSSMPSPSSPGDSTSEGA